MELQVYFSYWRGRTISKAANNWLAFIYRIQYHIWAIQITRPIWMFNLDNCFRGWCRIWMFCWRIGKTYGHITVKWKRYNIYRKRCSWHGHLDPMKQRLRLERAVCLCTNYTRMNTNCLSNWWFACDKQEMKLKHRFWAWCCTDAWVKRKFGIFQWLYRKQNNKPVDSDACQCIQINSMSALLNNYSVDCTRPPDFWISKWGKNKRWKIS